MMNVEWMTQIWINRPEKQVVPKAQLPQLYLFWRDYFNLCLAWPYGLRTHRCLEALGEPPEHIFQFSFIWKESGLHAPESKTKLSKWLWYSLQKHTSNLNWNSNVGIFTKESWLDVPRHDNRRRAAFKCMRFSGLVIFLIFVFIGSHDNSS